MACKNKTFESGFTIQRLEALEAAIAEGVLTVKYDDREITYRSHDAMMRIRSVMRKALGLAPTPSQPGLFGGQRRVMKHSKGL